MGGIWTMIVGAAIGGSILIATGLYLLWEKYKLGRLAPGNIWKTEDGEIAIIEDISLTADYYIKVSVNNKIRFYNAQGERDNNWVGTKLITYLGTIKNCPQYFL